VPLLTQFYVIIAPIPKKDLSKAFRRAPLEPSKVKQTKPRRFDMEEFPPLPKSAQSKSTQTLQPAVATIAPLTSISGPSSTQYAVTPDELIKLREFLDAKVAASASPSTSTRIPFKSHLADFHFHQLVR